MILQTDLVIAVRVITVVCENDTQEDVRERLYQQMVAAEVDLHDSIHLVRTDVVDHSAGGSSLTTTVVQE